ncbi:MAG: hypothetical protein GJV46_01480 [Geobacter sp.]|nr:hypothetical protein [Geobacter sp.]
MFESALASGLLTLVVIVAFMVACPVLCILFSIFSDSININGSFEKIGDSLVSLVFLPIVLFFKIIDTITSPFIEPSMKEAIENRNSMR